MDLAFIKVLNMSISASWLVLAVILLRFLLKKSPKWIHVALWALVAVRLICPVSIESPVSLVPSTRTLPQEIFYVEPPLDYQNATLEIVQPRPNGESVELELDTTLSVAQPRHVQWTLLWPAGMAVMMLWALISYFRLKRKVDASIDVGNGVYICDYIETPFILGIVKQKIYLPSSMEPDLATHVLAHERSHIARRDHWWKPFGYLLLTIYWFNPVLWVAYILLCRDIELACDEKVIRDMELPQKKAYSEALLSCSVNRRMIAACPLAFGEVGVKERVKTVLNYKKPAFWIVLVAVLALIVTAVCFLTDPVKADEDFGKIYQVEKVVYRNPVLSYYMTEADAPLFQVTEERELLLQQEPEQWESQGLFTRMDMTEENPADWFFGEELGWEGDEAFQTVLGNIQTAWIVELPDSQRPGHSRVYLLLRVDEGTMYLAEGYNAGNGPNINWLYRLKDAGVNEEENQNTPFGSHYRVDDMVYLDSNVGSYSPSDRFVYYLAPGRGFVEKEHISESGRNLFRFTPAELTQEQFAARMNDEALARELLASNKMAWEYYGYDHPNPQIKGFLYLLQQRDGQIFLVTGNNRTGELQIGYIFRLEKILSDDPFAESSSPYQWTLNIDRNYVESIRVTTHEEDGTPVHMELSEYDMWWFLSALNGVSKEELSFGTLAREPYIWAEILCNGETVELAYDKDAVSLTFRSSAASRYPQEAGKTWIITNDTLKSAMFAYNRYAFPESPFDQPDNAYHWCQTIDISLMDYVWASDTVRLDNRYEQAYALWLNREEIQSLLDLLKNIPESAFEPVEMSETGRQSIYIGCRDVWTSSYPRAQLYLLDGKVYYTYESAFGEQYQTWEIKSLELKTLVSSYFTGDYTGWERFAPSPIVTGVLPLDADGVALVIPQMGAFEYEITDEGIRFKPEDESGWVLIQYLAEPFAAKCGTGLKMMEGIYGGRQGISGYYDDAAYWSFIEITGEVGEEEYCVLILNEDGASWVMEYDWEITRMIGEMQIPVYG